MTSDEGKTLEELLDELARLDNLMDIVKSVKKPKQEEDDG